MNVWTISSPLTYLGEALPVGRTFCWTSGSPGHTEGGLWGNPFASLQKAGGQVTPETTFGVSGVTLPLVPQWHGHGVPAAGRPFGRPAGFDPNRVFHV
jgi:hypothetical protein